MKLRYAKHPYGVPKDDTRYDAGILRRVCWQISDWYDRHSATVDVVIYVVLVIASLTVVMWKP